MRPQNHLDVTKGPHKWSREKGYEPLEQEQQPEASAKPNNKKASKSEPADEQK